MLHLTAKVLLLLVLHAGYYDNPRQQKTKPWQEAQFDYIDAMLEVAGVKQAAQVRPRATPCFEGSNSQNFTTALGTSVCQASEALGRRQ